MKKYSKPQTLVIPFNIRQCILTGSDPVGATLKGDFDSSSEALSRQGFFGEDDEEYE